MSFNCVLKIFTQTNDIHLSDGALARSSSEKSSSIRFDIRCLCWILLKLLSFSLFRASILSLCLSSRSSTNKPTCRRRRIASSECWAPSQPPTSFRKSSASPSRYMWPHSDCLLLFFWVKGHLSGYVPLLYPWFTDYCVMMCIIQYENKCSDWLYENMNVSYLNTNLCRFYCQFYSLCKIN